MKTNLGRNEDQAAEILTILKPSGNTMWHLL